MIELVIQGDNEEDDRLLAQQLGGESGIVIASSESPHLTLRQDLDALLMNEIVSAEYLNIRPSPYPVPFMLDTATGKAVGIYPAVIGTAHPTEPHWWRGELCASWVVSYASFAPSPEDVKRMGAAARLPITEEEIDYIIVLDALEAMERHNATDAEPKIQRAGIETSANWAPGLLRAYREYQKRTEAGLYQ